MGRREYEVSDTKLTAEWVIGSPLRTYYECSNCGETKHIGFGVLLTDFCPQCGFKMTNPQWISVNVDYD